MKPFRSGIARALVGIICGGPAVLPGAVRGAADTNPAVRFTYVPPRGSNDDLQGCVTNVVYAQYGIAVYICVNAGWWTKPTFASPVTVIQSNGTWTCDITTGGVDTSATEVVAFLIPTNYTPPQSSGGTYLPPALYSNAVAFLSCIRPQWDFCGYEWGTKDSAYNPVGPGPNYFSESPSNVFVDAQGRLHLRITQREGLWYCAEVVTRRSFGYGTYRVYLDSPVDQLDSNVVLGLFTWDDDPDADHREFDVEITRWGNPGDTNSAQFVIQPWDLPNHIVRFPIPAGLTNTTHSFEWRTGRVDFASYHGHYAIPPATNTPILEWSFVSNTVPCAGNERFRMNLWLYNSTPPSDGQDVEVVVSRFVFVPACVSPPALADPAWQADSTIRFAADVEPQLSYDILTSTNLADWDAVGSIVATNGFLYVSHTNASTWITRYYRLCVPPQ